MTKQDLKRALRREFGLSWSEATRTIETLLSTIKSSLRASKSVSLRGFGTFSTRPTHTRRFRNIHTGKITTKLIAPRVRFKPSKSILKA